MASVVHSKPLQQGVMKQSPHVQELGSSAGSWSRRNAVSLIDRRKKITRLSKSRRNCALGALSIQPSSVRLPHATSESVSGIQKVDARAERTKIGINDEIQARAEQTGARVLSERPSPHYSAVEDSSRRLDVGIAQDRIDGRRVENSDRSSQPRDTAEDVNGGGDADRDEGSDEEEDNTGLVISNSVAAERTLSISESKRIRRSRIIKELLQRGTSPIELLENAEKCTAELFWTVVNILCHNSRAPEALLVFDWLKRQDGYVASEQQYTGFISICGHALMPDEAEKLFFEMIKLDLRPTVATYSCLLQGFAEAGNFDKAKDILGQMKEVGLQPNAITYTGLLHAYGKQGHYSEMAKIFNNMKTCQVSRPECAPTSVTYSALLQCYSKGGLFARMEKVLKEMMASDLDPDGNAVNAMIQGYAQAGLLKDMERAYSLVRPYQVKVRVETLRSVALAYIRKSYFYQLGTFARYHNRKRVSMGKLIENLLLLSHAANFSMRGLAEEYVRLRETGFEGDITSFNIRALAFSRMQMLWDLRVTILEMVHQGVLPDLVTYGAVVDAYVAGNLESSLAEALAEMPNLDRVAGVQTDKLVFEAFGRGDFQVCCEELIVGSEDIHRRYLTYANLVGYHLKRLEILSTRKSKKKSSQF